MTGYSKYIQSSPTQKLCFSPQQKFFTYNRWFFIAISGLKKKPLLSIPDYTLVLSHYRNRSIRMIQEYSHRCSKEHMDWFLNIR